MGSLPCFQEFLRGASQPLRTELSSPASGRGSSISSPCRELTPVSTKRPQDTERPNHLLLEQGLSQHSWFRPHSRLAQRALDHVKDLSRDQLHNLYWQVDPDRALYGAASAVKAPTPAARPAGMPLTKWQQQQQHKCVETERRDRARRCQHISHAGTCELANIMAEQGDVAECLDLRSVVKPNKTKSSSKAPGKDDQLEASIAMQHLSGIVVRSEHAGRVAAERKVAELQERVRRLEAQSYAGLQDSPALRKRPHNFDTHAHSAKRQRLPPSPSLSPCLTQSPSSTIGGHLTQRRIIEA